MKILTFIITFGINIAVAVVLLFFLLLSLNGFQGSDADWGINLYAVLAVLAALLSSILSILAFGWLINKKQLPPFAVALISILSFVVLGSILNFVSLIFGIIMADVKRVNF